MCELKYVVQRCVGVLVLNIFKEVREKTGLIYKLLINNFIIIYYLYNKKKEKSICFYI